MAIVIRERMGQTPPLSRIKQRGGKKHLERNNEITIFSTLLKIPDRSHIFFRDNLIIAYFLDRETGDYTIHEWYVPLYRSRSHRNEIWNRLKTHPSAPMFWLLMTPEKASGGFGSFFEIDPRGIKNYPQDLRDQKIMFLALNPKYPSNWGIPHPVIGHCLYCEELFTAADSRQHYCPPPKNCRRKAEYKLRRERNEGKFIRRRCENCGSRLRGRSDKRFCSDNCRKTFSKKGGNFKSSSPQRMQ